MCCLVELSVPTSAFLRNSAIFAALAAAASSPEAGEVGEVTDDVPDAEEADPDSAASAAFRAAALSFNAFIFAALSAGSILY